MPPNRSRLTSALKATAVGALFEQVSECKEHDGRVRKGRGVAGVKEKITIIMIITTTHDRVCSMIRVGRFAIPVFVRDKQENV